MNSKTISSKLNKNENLLVFQKSLSYKIQLSVLVSYKCMWNGSRIAILYLVKLKKHSILPEASYEFLA